MKTIKKIHGYDVTYHRRNQGPTSIKLYWATDEAHARRQFKLGNSSSNIIDSILRLSASQERCERKSIRQSLSDAYMKGWSFAVTKAAPLILSSTYAETAMFYKGMSAGKKALKAAKQEASTLTKE